MQQPSKVQEAVRCAEEIERILEAILADGRVTPAEIGTGRESSEADTLSRVRLLARDLTCRLVACEAIQRAGITFIRTGHLPRDLVREFDALDVA